MRFRCFCQDFRWQGRGFQQRWCGLWRLNARGLQREEEVDPMGARAHGRAEPARACGTASRLAGGDTGVIEHRGQTAARLAGVVER